MSQFPLPSVRRALSALAVLAAVPLASYAALDDVGHAPASKHRIRFVLHPDVVAGLTPAETGRRLGQYVADMNAVFLRESVRSFLFDPATDVRLLQGSETCVSVSALVPNEVQICAEKSTSGYSHGGYAGSSPNPHAGVITGLKWHTLYDPLQLSRQVVPPALVTSEEDYLVRQLRTLLHEAEHVFGAGMGEYYNLASITDRSGVAPTQDLSLLTETDRFWYQHATWTQDPLLRYPAYRQREDFLGNIRFAAGTKAMVNTDWSAYPWSSNYMAGTAATVVRLTDRVSGAALAGASVMVWRIPQPSQVAATLVGQGSTDANGRFVFNWACGSCFNNYDGTLLVKAWAPGRLPAVKWFSIFDAFEQKAVQGKAEFVIDLQPAFADAQAPSIALFAPSNATVGVPIALQVRQVADNTAVWGVKVSTGTETVCTVTVDANCTWFPPTAGSYQFRAVAMDPAGNSKVATVQVMVNAPSDVQPPSITVTPPAVAKAGVGLMLYPQVSDNVAVTHIQLHENGRFLGVVSQPPFAVRWTPAAKGYTNLEIRAKDTSGNTSSTSFGIVVQ